MERILVVLFLLSSIGMVALILMQHGKGADAGAAFGSGASSTVFGSQGASNFLSRTTAILGTIWFVIALALAYYSMNTSDDPGLMDQMGDEVVEAVAGDSVIVPEVSADLPDVPEFAPAEQSDLPDIPAPPSVTDAPEVPEAPAVVPEVATDVPDVPEPVEEVKEVVTETQEVVEAATGGAEEIVKKAVEAVEEATAK